MGVEPGSRDLAPLIDSVKTRSRTILDIAAQSRSARPGALDPGPQGHAVDSENGDDFVRNLRLAATALDQVSESDWRPETILAALKASAESNQVKLGDAMQPSGWRSPQQQSPSR
jgi:hypothetical protein